MKNRINSFLLLITLFVSNHAHSVDLYSEDFTNDPGFISSSSSNVNGMCTARWDQGDYYAEVQDVSDPWHCIGIGLMFTNISSTDNFVIEFDFNPILPDWGHYPGIYFTSANTVEEWRAQNPRSGFRLIIDWQDQSYKKLRFIVEEGGIYYRSSSIPAENEWYHVKIDYNATAATANLVIERASGEVFFSETNVPFPISGTFNRVFIGEIQNDEIRYGNVARIRVDNISVQSESRGIEKPQISVSGGYIKLDATAGAQPSQYDCSLPEHYGRQSFDEINDILYICTTSGWSAH